MVAIINANVPYKNFLCSPPHFTKWCSVREVNSYTTHPYSCAQLVSVRRSRREIKIVSWVGKCQLSMFLRFMWAGWSCYFESSGAGLMCLIDWRRTSLLSISGISEVKLGEIVERWRIVDLGSAAGLRERNNFRYVALKLLLRNAKRNGLSAELR